MVSRRAGLSSRSQTVWDSQKRRPGWVYCRWQFPHHTESCGVWIPFSIQERSTKLSCLLSQIWSARNKERTVSSQTATNGTSCTEICPTPCILKILSEFNILTQSALSKVMHSLWESRGGLHPAAMWTGPSQGLSFRTSIPDKGTTLLTSATWVILPGFEVHIKTIPHCTLLVVVCFAQLFVCEVCPCERVECGAPHPRGAPKSIYDNMEIVFPCCSPGRIELIPVMLVHCSMLQITAQWPFFCVFGAHA